jgi:hypothetical protein
MSSLRDLAFFCCFIGSMFSVGLCLDNVLTINRVKTKPLTQRRRDAEEKQKQRKAFVRYDLNFFS